MPHQIRRDEVQELLGRGAQLVEVLPANEYREDHLPGLRDPAHRRHLPGRPDPRHPERLALLRIQPVRPARWARSDRVPRLAP